MKICLVRHGPAGDAGPQWPDDRLRPLTAKGRRQMEEAAAGLAGLFVPAAIVSSPYTRAAQTAEILQTASGVIGMHFTDALVNGDYDTLFWELARLNAPSVAVVGHMPDMLGILSVLVTGRPETLAADFGKGTAALVECTGAPAPGAGTLAWMLPRRTLAALGRGAR